MPPPAARRATSSVCRRIDKVVFDALGALRLCHRQRKRTLYPKAPTICCGLRTSPVRLQRGGKAPRGHAPPLHEPAKLGYQYTDKAALSVRRGFGDFVINGQEAGGGSIAYPLEGASGKRCSRRINLSRNRISRSASASLPSFPLRRTPARRAGVRAGQACWHSFFRAETI